MNGGQRIQMFTRARTYRPSLWARWFLADNWRLKLDPARRDRIAMGAGEDIACLDITSVTITKAILWHSIQIRAQGRLDTLAGLSSTTARRLHDDLLNFVNLHLSDHIEHGKDQLRVVDEAITTMVQAKRQYFAQADIGRAIAGIPGSASQALSHPLFDAARMPSAVRSHLPTSFSILIDQGERARYNDAFVAHEMQTFEPFFDDLGGVSLSDEQREACIRLEDSNLLVASAGSGKSATMVGKVAYVLEKGVHTADEILVLAFNKSAADELKERIARQLAVPVDDLGSGLIARRAR